MDPCPQPSPAWFADAGILTNSSTIRNYLQQYSQHCWPEVTKLTLIYGIVALQHTQQGRTLSLAQLQAEVQRCASALVVQHSVPKLQRQILDLQSQLDNVFDALAVEV